MNAPLSTRHLRLWSAAISFLVSACGGGGTHVTSGRPPTHAPSPTISIPRASEDAADQGDRPTALSLARSIELGLSAPDELTPALGSEPEVVAARFVLADSNYAASEDAAVVNARRAVFAASRLAADVVASSSGAARIEELRRRGGRFTGEIEAIATTEASDLLAVVELTARVVLTTNDRPPELRIRYYLLTLGRDVFGGRWFVVRAEQS